MFNGFDLLTSMKKLKSSEIKMLIGKTNDKNADQEQD